MEKLVVGKVTLFREKCPECHEYNLSGNKTFVCTRCDVTYGKQNIRKTRIITKRRRVPPPKKIKQSVLKKQQNKCYWCGREFGMWYTRPSRNTMKQLSVAWDHRLPYNYLQRNPDDNWVASCHICNGMKSDMVFDDPEECRNYLKKRWEESLTKGQIRLL